MILSSMLCLAVNGSNRQEARDGSATQRKSRDYEWHSQGTGLTIVKSLAAKRLQATIAARRAELLMKVVDDVVVTGDGERQVNCGSYGGRFYKCGAVWRLLRHVGIPLGLYFGRVQANFKVGSNLRCHGHQTSINPSKV